MKEEKIVRKHTHVFINLLLGLGILVLSGAGCRNERNIIGSNGMPLLSGPISAGGPTYGQSEKADLEVTDFGWVHSTTTGDKACSAQVTNKSNRTWHNVTVEIEIFYPDREPDRVSISLGTLKPGAIKSDVSQVVKGEHAISRLLGVTGK